MGNQSAIGWVFLLCCWLPGMLRADFVDFDDLSLSANSYWNGSSGSGGFTSRGAQFNNQFTDWGGGVTSWSGWAYSNVNNVTTSGFTNQYAAFSGTGYGGSGIYGIGYAGGVVPTVVFPAGSQIQSMYVTNTTYAALSMRDGDSFSKKFGGSTGNDPDWFKLTITGKAGTATIGSVEHHLADFRSADNAQDFILRDWQLVDLSSLSGANQLEFALSSTDNGIWGMNTPAYFAADQFSFAAIPEPSTLVLTLLGGIAAATVLARISGRKRSERNAA